MTMSKSPSFPISAYGVVHDVDASPQKWKLNLRAAAPVRVMDISGHSYRLIEVESRGAEYHHSSPGLTVDEARAIFYPQKSVLFFKQRLGYEWIYLAERSFKPSRIGLNAGHQKK